MRVLYVMMPVNLDTSIRLLRCMSEGLGWSVEVAVALASIDERIAKMLAAAGFSFCALDNGRDTDVDVPIEAILGAFSKIHLNEARALGAVDEVEAILSNFVPLLERVDPDVVLCDGQVAAYVSGCAEYAKASGRPVLRWEHISVPGLGEHVFAFDAAGMFFNRGETDLHLLYNRFRQELPRGFESQARRYLSAYRDAGATRDAERNTQHVRINCEPGEIAVFVPGQLPFDSNVTGCQRKFATTEDMAAAVALSDPRIRLFYKPHPSGGDHDNGSAIAQLRNVVVVSREANVYELMRQATATITLSSNVGLEAVLHGFRIGCTSSTHYNLPGLCHDLLGYGRLDLSGISEWEVPDEELTVRYVAALLSYVADLDRPETVAARFARALETKEGVSA